MITKNYELIVSVLLVPMAEWTVCPHF